MASKCVINAETRDMQKNSDILRPVRDISSWQPLFNNKIYLKFSNSEFKPIPNYFSLEQIY